VYRPVQRYGIDAKLFEWSDEIMAEYKRKHSKNLYEQCGARGRACQRWSKFRNGDYFFQMGKSESGDDATPHR
jgi:hypothetical protein